MSGISQNAIDPSKMSAVNLLIHQLSLLMTALVTASRQTNDPIKLSQLANEATAVQSLMSQASQAQIAANDVQFAQTTVVLKAQASVLQGMASQIQTVVSDVALAGQIAGYIAQAIALIAQL